MAEFRLEVKSQKALEVSIAGDASIKTGAEGLIIATSVGTIKADEKNKERIILSCDKDCEIQIPAGLVLNIQNVGGDAMLSNLEGGLTVISISGDLLMRDTAAAEILSVGGDLEASLVKGELSIEHLGGDFLGSDLESAVRIKQIGGDITLSKVQGLMEIEKISGDLMVNDAHSIHARKVKGEADLFRVRGDITLKASGDINLQPSAEGMSSIALEAGGDIDLYWPPELGANFNLNSDGGEIAIELDDRDEELETHHAKFTHGDGKVMVVAHANGDVSITSRLRKAPRVEVTGVAATGDDGGSWEEAFTGKFQENWDRVEREFDQFPQRFEKTFGEKMHQVEDRIEKAMHKVRHGVKMDKDGRRAVVIATALAGKQSQKPGIESDQKGSAVTEDERKMILKMLQEKKISVEEAEKLFETLEGRNEDTGSGG